MKEVDREALAPLEARLGHRFANPSLLVRSLTHKSFLNENPAREREDNERLEFLGDALLGLTIGSLLMETFPQRTEGGLSTTRAQIVSEQGLAKVAFELGLGEWLFLGRGEEQSGGRRKPSVLADACEAVMGAVFLDAGFDAARAVVLRLFGEAIHAAFESGRPDDFKSRIQERAQAEWQLQPRYTVIDSAGPDHNRTFEVALFIGDREYARARGKNKKEAEQRAAERGLTLFEAERAGALPVDDPACLEGIPGAIANAVAPAEATFPASPLASPSPPSHAEAHSVASPAPHSSRDPKAS